MPPAHLYPVIAQGRVVAGEGGVGHVPRDEHGAPRAPPIHQARRVAAARATLGTLQIRERD
jgi:hypothetical protein